MFLKSFINRLSPQAAGPRDVRCGAAARLALKNFYHQCTVDKSLADAVFSQLSDDSNWAVALYLLFAPEDRNIFNSWDVRRNLKELVARLFQEQAGGVDDAAADTTAVEWRALREWGFSLRLDDEDKPFHCRLQKSSGAENWFGVDADIFISEGPPALTAAGQLVALTRALPVVPDEARVRGLLTCEGDISVAPHLDLSQRQARGRGGYVYITEAEQVFLIGPHAGCDLLAPLLPVASRLTCDARTGRVTCDAREVLSDAGRARGAGFSVSFLSADPSGAPTPDRFRDMLEGRARKRDYSLRVVARVLPRERGGGPYAYGADWCEIGTPRRPIRVSLRVAGGMLLAVDDAGTVLLWDESHGAGRGLKDGETVVVEGRSYTWREDGPGPFYGSLLIDRADAVARQKLTAPIPADQPFCGVIARGGAAGVGRPPLLTGYDEDTLISHRGSILLKSDGKGGFELSVPEPSSGRPIFTLEGGAWRQHGDGEARAVALKAPGEFAFGSSCFSLTEDGRAYRLHPHWSGLFQVLV
jgi:hypothetical protein